MKVLYLIVAVNLEIALLVVKENNSGEGRGLGMPGRGVEAGNKKSMGQRDTTR